jgi:hypothetical protein
MKEEAGCSLGLPRLVEIYTHIYAHIYTYARIYAGTDARMPAYAQVRMLGLPLLLLSLSTTLKDAR